MKQLRTLLIGLFVALVCCAQPVSGQENTEGTMSGSVEDTRPPDTTQRFKFGIWGNLHTGVTIGSFGNLRNGLREPATFNNADYVVRGLGSVIGGNAHVLLFKRLIVGLGGTRFGYTSSLSLREVSLDTANYANNFDNFSRGEVSAVTTVAHGMLGFAVINKRQWLVFPYVGYLTGENTLTIKNYSPDVLRWGSASIDRARTAEFTSTVGLLEVGVGARFFKYQRGGLSVGAELGGYFSLGESNWEDSDGREVTGVPASTLSGGYLRVTVGGGIFSTTQPVAPRAARMNEAGNSAPRESAEPADDNRRERRNRRGSETAPAE